MDWEFSGEVWYWRGPAPWFFVTVPADVCLDLQATSAVLSYGWGMIPVTAAIGASVWGTSLFPKDGSYVVPVKAAVRRAESIEKGDMVTLRLSVAV